MKNTTRRSAAKFHRHAQKRKHHDTPYFEYIKKEDVVMDPDDYLKSKNPCL